MVFHKSFEVSCGANAPGNPPLKFPFRLLMCIMLHARHAGAPRMDLGCERKDTLYTLQNQRHPRFRNVSDSRPDFPIILTLVVDDFVVNNVTCPVLTSGRHFWNI